MVCQLSYNVTTSRDLAGNRGLPKPHRTRAIRFSLVKILIQTRQIISMFLQMISILAEVSTVICQTPTSLNEAESLGVPIRGSQSIR
jgi:hypothetical protein